MITMICVMIMINQHHKNHDHHKNHLLKKPLFQCPQRLLPITNFVSSKVLFLFVQKDLSFHFRF
jgi:hypothetical protein